MKEEDCEESGGRKQKLLVCKDDQHALRWHWAAMHAPCHLLITMRVICSTSAGVHGSV